MVVAGPATGDILLLVFVFKLACVVEGSGPVGQVSVVVEDAGEQCDRFVGVVCDPVAVAGQGVVVQELVEVAAGPAVSRWLGQYVGPGGGGEAAGPSWCSWVLAPSGGQQHAFLVRVWSGPPPSVGSSVVRSAAFGLSGCAGGG